MKTMRVADAIWSDGPYRATKTGLIVQGTPTFEQWERALYNLCKNTTTSAWTLGDMINEGRGKWEQDDRYESALQATGLKYQTLANHAWVSRRFPQPLRDEHIDLVNVPFSWARLLVPLEDPPVFELLERAKVEHWDYEEFAAHAKGDRRDRQERERAFPAGTFGVIYANPPWTRVEVSDEPDAPASDRYRKMTLGEIQKLTDANNIDVKTVFAPDCVLYMWTPDTKVDDAKAVLKAWGFTQKAFMVWVSDTQGPGRWARSRHELLMVATKGQPLPPRENDIPDSVIIEPRGDESDHPASFYDLLDRIYPGVPKLELFQKQPRPGWDGWTVGMLAEGPRAIILRDEPPPDVDQNAGAEDAMTALFNAEHA